MLLFSGWRRRGDWRTCLLFAGCLGALLTAALAWGPALGQRAPALLSGTIPPLTPTLTATSSSPGAPLTGTLYLPWIEWHHPLQPWQPSPPAGAINQSPNVYFTWGQLAPGDQLVTYEIALSANLSPPTEVVAVALQGRAFDPPTLTPNTQYFWRVTAIDAQGQRIDGPVWNFWVEPAYDPPLLGSMVTVPAGEFWMGCVRTTDDYGCQLTRELPLHLVYLDAYEIDKYEVTNAEYRACVTARVCRAPRRFDAPRRSRYYNNATYDLYPVMYVSWYDAQNYCGWLGKRLPTEAEWEKAARGVIDTRTWPWGEEEPTCERANHRISCGRVTSRVGSYPTGASPYGVMDMAGNIFEWVADKYDVTYYANSPYANPPGPERARMGAGWPPAAIDYYTLRGGSYHDNWWYSRVTHRHWGHHGDWPNGDSPLFRSFRAGFRCARPLAQP